MLEYDPAGRLSIGMDLPTAIRRWAPSAHSGSWRMWHFCKQALAWHFRIHTDTTLMGPRSSL